MSTHTYATSLAWSGRTENYADYSRDHESRIGGLPLVVSADKAFRGDPDLPNPETMLVGAASSCQLLSFLAVAALSGITVLEYRDQATAVMQEADGGPMRITDIVLRPRVVVEGADSERVTRLLHKAHTQCYIANTLTASVTLEPTVEVR